MITPEELLEYIGGDDYDATKVEELERAAVAFVQTQTGRYFGPPELVEEFIIGGGMRRLWLRDHPTAVDGESGSSGSDPVITVAERLWPGDPDSTALVDGTAFALRQYDREWALVRYAGDVWTADQEFGVTYYRGYLPGEEPDDIWDLVLNLVRFGWENQLEGRTGLKSEQISGYGYTRFGDSDVDAVSGNGTLSAWKRPVFA